MTSISRRQVLGSIGLATGAGLSSSFGGSLHSAPQYEHKPARDWNYVHLDPDVIAAEAYRLFADGGCMYGLFGAVVTGLASKRGEPFRSFPIAPFNGHFQIGGLPVNLGHRRLPVVLPQSQGIQVPRTSLAPGAILAL